MVSRFMFDPHLEHWKVAKIILRYIKGNYKLGLEYQYASHVQLANIQTLIGQEEILMIENQLLDISFILILEQSHGVERSKLQSFYHQQKLNIKEKHLHHKKLHG
jgi:hypothetical protein